MVLRSVLFLSIFIGFFAVAPPIEAKSVEARKSQLRGITFCFPAKSVPKIVDEIAQVKDKYRNIVDVKIDPKFIIKDGGAWPEKFYLAREGMTVTDMPFSKEDGRVPSFMSEVRAAPDTDICIDDPARADRPANDEGLYFEMGLSPFFENRSGKHSMAELNEGTKDGKKFYKKMLPDAFAFLMPSTNYLAVKYDVVGTPLQAFALIDGKEVPVSSERHKDFDVIDCEELQGLNATALIIRGGSYQLQPVPSPSVMRRFGWGQDDES